MRNKALDELSELVRIVSRAAPEKNEIFSEWRPSSTSPAYAKLFHAILKEEYDNENDLARLTGHAAAHEKSYQVLRHNLLNRMRNMLFLLDLKRANHSTSSRIRYASDRDLFIVRCLVHFGARNLANRLAASALTKATEYERWLNAAEFARVLRQTAAIEGDFTQHKRYSQESEQYTAIWLAEQSAEEGMEMAKLHFARSGSEKPELVGPVMERLTAVEADRDRYKTFGLALNAIRMRAFVAQLKPDYRLALAICDEAEDLFKQYPRFASRARTFEFLVKRIKCAYHLRDHSESLRALEICATTKMEGNNNWFVFKEYEFLISMHAFRFAEASGVRAAVVGHARFCEQSEAIRLRWETIYTPWSDFVMKKRMAKDVRREFLAKAPDYARDKINFNIAILALQVLVLAAEGKTASVFERIEALKDYPKRHLKAERSRQSKLFFELLFNLDAHLVGVESAVAQCKLIVEELRATPLADESAEGGQIMPYEWIWEQILLACMALNAHEKKSIL